MTIAWNVVNKFFVLRILTQKAHQESVDRKSKNKDGPLVVSRGSPHRSAVHYLCSLIPTIRSRSADTFIVLCPTLPVHVATTASALDMSSRGGLNNSREGSNAWANMARMMSGGNSTASSVKSEPQSTTGSTSDKRRAGVDNEDFHNIGTSDASRFPPPKKTREEGIRAKRDHVTGWVMKGKTDDPSSGVNVIRKDERLIELALEGKATLESQLRICSKPIIGLNHVVEFVDPDVEAALRVYYCKLCNVFRSAATILEHICSYHHRVRTLRKAFPHDSNMFLEPDKKTINRNPGLMNVATKRANEYELVYGRGEVEVRHERPSYPENQLDGDESEEIVIVDTKQLEYLEVTLKEMKTLKIQSADESRVANAICSLLTDQLCKWRIEHPNA